MMKQGPLSGQTLGGKYLLGELLGKGGFGAVYKAANQMLRRQQAVKVLLEEHFSEEKFRDRFLREARTLAALDHANIVHVDDIGIEGSFIYLVMPYISGGTLQDILKARPGPLSLEVATRSLEQICSALGYAHAQGIAHLDLKPLNLLVHQDGRLLLSDFGLAHLMEQGAIEGGTSLQFGSPLYMAPEHFEGMPTQRSDLYALGVILYQMLTGRHPFEASTPAAIMRKHLTEPPPPLHLARPDLPVALDAVLGKALAKQQEQRYERAGELLFDFRAALGGQALRFASSAEATRLSQAALDPTQRAVNPPISSAGPTLAGMGPTVPPPISRPMGPPLSMSRPIPPPPPPPGYYISRVPRPPPASAPGKPKIWTPGFTRLFVLTAVVWGVITLVVNILINSGSSFTPIDGILVFILGVGAAICLVGLRFTRSRLLRIGLLLQAGSFVSNLVLFALFFYINTGGGDSPAIVRWTEINLPVILTVLSVFSMIALSYGIAPWQQSRDAWFTVLEVIVSGIAAYLLLLNFSSIYADRFYFEEGGSPFLFWVTMTAVLFAATVFLLRPVCWRQQPAATLLLALGTILFVFQAPGAYSLLIQWLPSIVTFLHALYSGWLLSWLLFLLGFLLLIQTERARKRAQQAQPAQAVVGQPRV